MFRRCARILACIVLIVIGIGTTASASYISPGYDLFTTVPEMTYVQIDDMKIHLRGDPIGQLKGVNLFDTDTIVQRHTGIDPFPVGTMGTVDIELVALHLRSVEPIPLGGLFFDLEVLGGSLIGGPTSPIGTLLVSHTYVNGGIFYGELPVKADLTFTEVGNPTNKFTQDFFDTFISLGVWSHIPRTDDVHTDEVLPFPAGFFYAGVDPHLCCGGGQKVLTLEQARFAAHGVLPAQVPVPPTFLLFGVGAFRMLSYYSRRCI